MRLLSQASTPLESWIHAATWYSQVARWKNVVLPEDAELQAKIVALHDSLVAEAEALSELYAFGTRAVDKRLVEILPLVVLEIETQAGETFEGMGGLGAVGLLSRFKKYKKLGAKAWEIGKWLLIAWGVVKLGPPAIKLGTNILDAFNKLLESDEEKALRIRETTLEIASARNKAIQDCLAETDPSAKSECLAATNEAFDIVTPATDCGLLDTPAGTSIGGIVGLLGGYVGSETVLSWVEE
jgi:hypothetical protein